MAAGGAMRGMPVVLVLDPAMAHVVVAGAVRAGQGIVVQVLAKGDESSLISAVSAGADVAIVSTIEAPLDLLRRVTALGGDAIPALDVVQAGGSDIPGPIGRSLLANPGLFETNVPVPVLEDPEARRAFWEVLRAEGLEARAHLVEVDGRPALDELWGWGNTGLPPTPFLAAGAAGVLAGRMAAGDRRWRLA
jgi:hypothetical protein